MQPLPNSNAYQQKGYPPMGGQQQGYPPMANQQQQGYPPMNNMQNGSANVTYVSDFIFMFFVFIQRFLNQILFRLM